MDWLNTNVLTGRGASARFVQLRGGGVRRGSARREFPLPPHFLAPGGRPRAARPHWFFSAFSNHADRRRAWWGIPPEARPVQRLRRLEGYIMPLMRSWADDFSGGRKVFFQKNQQIKRDNPSL